MRKPICSRISSKSKVGLTLVAIALLITLLVVHILISGRSDLPLLIGSRCNAIFDLWSFQHVLAGIIFTSLLYYTKTISGISWQELAIILILVDFSWEAAELAMESGLLGHSVAHWKQGFEHWGNRFIGDPMMAAFGGLLARRFKSAWKWALVPAFVWLIANVFSPSSMYIQQLLF